MKPAFTVEQGSNCMFTTVSNPNVFATRLNPYLAGRAAGQNLFLSPFSIEVALAMCAVGARGETRRVLTELIGAPENVERQNRQYTQLIKSVHGEGTQRFELSSASALWGQQGYQFHPEFQQAVATYYHGSLQEVDFVGQPDKAVTRINDWVSEQTRQKIPKLIQRGSINRDTRLILTNAIYFKAKWEEAFKKRLTKDAYWYGPHGTRQVPTMHQSKGYRYFENEEFQAIDLPYIGQRLGMLVVLPRAKNGLDALEVKWATQGLFEQVTKELRYEEDVEVSLPRFKMETEFNLTSVLSDMGAKLAFSDHADLGGISDDRERPLKISEVVHKAFVEVNEEGTEAAAATGVSVRCVLSTPYGTKKHFQADHPFLFFIRDRQTNVILFSGRLIDPQ
jgi:serpin B